ncbi:MAG: hypothetical protein IPF41_05130 [Flavobacteriales bacterium]|nr:hypothetical protein [Flavobacteriales bacterium]
MQVQNAIRLDKKEAETRAEQEKKDQRQRLGAQRHRRRFGFALLFLGVVWRQRNRISKEKARSEELLLNIPPEEVAEELTANASRRPSQSTRSPSFFTDFSASPP